MRKNILTVHDKNVNFFVANCRDIENPVSRIYIDIIRKKPYNFGIILNGSIYDPALTKILPPLYSTNDRDSYFILDVIQGSNYLRSPKKIYRFVFVDIASLFHGKFNNNRNQNIFRICDNCEDNFFEDDLEKSFNDWLIGVVSQSNYYDKLFIVSNESPFYYLKMDPRNIYINDFLEIIEVQADNIRYLTTDNDYYNDVSIYRNHNGIDLLSKVNYTLTGCISEIKKPSSLFVHKIGFNFFERVYFSSDFQNKSGYINIEIDHNIVKINYETMHNYSIINLIMTKLIRLMEKSDRDVLKKEQKEMLSQFMIFAKKKNLFSSYKNIKMGKNGLTNVLRSNFIDKIEEYHI